MSFHSAVRGGLAESLAISLVLGLAAFARAQSSPPEFPQDPGNWLNAQPLSLKALEGKAAVLYFFEESCPRCASRWPELLASARKYEGKPIAFIAVNSGNPKADVATYVREKKINWPVLIDPDRSYEKRYGVNPISLNNIFSLRMITADGTLANGNAQALEESADRALQGAHWNVDPAGMPATMKPAWTAVEFGNYAAAATAVKAGLKSNKPDVKTAAEKLAAHVNIQLERRHAAAQKAATSSQPWDAYKGYLALLADFKGYDLPADAEKAAKELAAGDAVKAEVAAQKRLESARKMLGTSAAAQKRGIKLLEQLSADAPTTEAAEQAKQLLTQLQAGN